jgi:integrase/recombinase XerD
LELFLRWIQDTRQFKPSTMSRRFSAVVAGFYLTAVIDSVLDRREFTTFDPLPGM